MNRKVKRYDPISSDGTCGMCIEDADYGAYVEYEDYSALEAECERLRPVLAMVLQALDRDAAEGKAARGEMAAELRAALAASTGQEVEK